MEKINVLIADDHSMIRQGIKQILELENDIQVIGQAGNGIDAVRLADELKPDIVLMDINMPGLNGIQATAEIKQKGIPVKIIMLTIHDDNEYLFKTVNLGAEGYVLKDADSAVLIDAIRTVYGGENYVQPHMAARLIKEFNRSNSQDKGHGSDSNSLSEREVEVLKLIADGLLNKEIADRLNISEKTVKNHVSNIFRKIDVADRTQAAIYAIRKDIVKK